MEYVVSSLEHAPDDASCDWHDRTWSRVLSLAIRQFHPKSSDHRPDVAAKIGYRPDSLCVIFRVHDQYVRSVCRSYQDTVCQDSCVELFVRPKPEKGYFNFEVNCGGTMLLYYIEDHVIEGGEFRKYQKVSSELARQVRIASTMPQATPVELSDPLEWQLQMVIPRTLMEQYVGPIQWSSNQILRANLFKCADATSHPHWASWTPIGPILNFHQPEMFGNLRLE